MRMTLNRLAFILLWIFVFTIPMAYATEIPGIGSISTAAGMAAIVGAAIAAAVGKKVRILGPAHMAMAAFVLWSAVTLWWSVAPTLTIHRIAAYLQLFVLVLLVWQMCTGEKDVLRILSAFVLGTIIPALSTLKGFLPGQDTLVQRATFLAGDGTGYDANQLAFVLALSLPAAYFLILRENGPLVSLYRLQMGFAVCAILLTGSPNAMIAMAVGLSIVCWTFHTLAIRTRINVFVILVVLGAGTMLVPSQVWKGTDDQIHKGDITFTVVINRELDSLHSTPIGGFGAGTQSRPAVASSERLGGRPTVFTLVSETGPIGVACFLAVLGVLALSAATMPGINKSFWLTSLGVWTVGALSLNWDCSQPAWLVFGLLAAHSACSNNRPARQTETSKTENHCFDKPAEACS